MAGQWDILFYKDYAISHLIDEATRFTVASILPGRSGVDFIRAIDKDWVRIFGPPRLIVADCETGLDTEEVRQWLDRLPSEVNPKAPGEHATTVERHLELLRDLLHKVEGQLAAEGIVLPFDSILAEC